ncbi:MAG: ABC transporter substrate-binding protein [Tepidibacter sp.]|jgi:putative spermidine/putrescine transport system substrate-binding protein|uniref:ABC transporter substrate-binding protein n=1 Tax=Tepidibacter sp. TaxID=2529387 RepID=UPI0025EFD23A|nr:ABC transporter substrate-binding protein [Tepidibacter sp.]MCT4508050.1 ABC transporter substrate-binding protein [Tepidibacter sp.]
MKRIIAIVLLILVSLGVLSGCSNQEKEESLNLLEMKWEDIAKEASDQTVNIYMWAGDKSVNEYMDNWIKPLVKEELNINLNRVPINDPKDMINKLITEKEVDKSNGSIDIIWMNGENFKLANENNLLWGPFVDKLPNYNQYVDKEADDIKYDFGEDTMGMEVPFGKSQFVFIYDSEVVKNPPKDIKELTNWIKQNPGKFTYPSIPDFTGSAFIRQTYMDLFKKDYVEDKDLSGMWDYMNEIKPYLWRKGETYPESSAKLDMLYSNSEILMTMSYNPLHAFNKVQSGEFKESTDVFVLNDGTLSNTHYLSVPFNASNKAGAMAVIDFLLSPKAQIQKLNPTNWGDGLSISYDKLSDEDKLKIDKIYKENKLEFLNEIRKYKIPEMKAEYIDKIEKGWTENVSKN